MTFEQELRAHALLQWVPYAIPSEFDVELADQGHYTKLQRQRSSTALDAWDKEHLYVRSDELSAFHELERLGVYTQNDFFSPTKAKHGYYTKRLKEHTATARQPSGASGTIRAARKVRRRSPL